MFSSRRRVDQRRCALVAVSMKVIMDFRFELDAALHEKTAAEKKEMFTLLGIDRTDVSGFLDGRCCLGDRELQQLLTYLGFRLVR